MRRIESEIKTLCQLRVFVNNLLVLASEIINLMLTTLATKSVKIVIFNHLMLDDCDNSVTYVQGAQPGRGLEN